MDKLLAPMSWQPCWIPAMRYGTNLCMEPLSWTDPDTPWATFTRSPSLESQCAYVGVTMTFCELMSVKRTPTWSSASDCCFSPWHPGSPFLCTFSDARHQKKSILLELQWSPPARTPSWLGGDKKENTSSRNQKWRYVQQTIKVLLHLWMHPGPEPSPHVPPSESPHRRLPAPRIAGRTLQPCTQMYLGAARMPSLHIFDRLQNTSGIWFRVTWMNHEPFKPLLYLPGWCRWSHSPCPPSEHPHQRQSGFWPVQLSPLEGDRDTEMWSAWELGRGTL